mgnify:CR=1 FL=1
MMKRKISVLLTSVAIAALAQAQDDNAAQAQEAAASMALARLPRPRVSQASAGQVRSAGVRTDRFIGSLAEAKDSRWVAAESTRSESAWSPAR